MCGSGMSGPCGVGRLQSRGLFQAGQHHGALPPAVSDLGLRSNSAVACHSEPEAGAQTPRLAVAKSLEAAVVCGELCYQGDGQQAQGHTLSCQQARACGYKSLLIMRLFGFSI